MIKKKKSFDEQRGSVSWLVNTGENWSNQKGIIFLKVKVTDFN